MILDNRQVPDIIVSRDGTNQNNNNNNNNNNARHGSANNGSPKHGGGKNGNHGSPRHVNFDSPKHVNYGSNAGPRQGSLGGSNGNGSPRHVSYGSPRHTPYSVPRHRNGNELPDSPCHNPVSGYNNNGSPRHVNRNGGCGYSHVNPASPRHSSSLSHDGNGNGSPRHHMNINCSNHGSPRHVIRNGAISPRFMQRVYSFDHGHGSPKHMAAVRTGSCDDSSIPHGQNYHHQHQRPIMNHHLQHKVQNHQHQQQKHSNHNQHQKQHYQHQQLVQQQQQHLYEQERASRTPSKIPVHVQERSSRDRANSLDRTTKEDRSSSPKRSQLRKGRCVLASTPIRRSSELDLKNTDFKTVIKEYSQLSPKRVNLRNKNQNLFKYGSCRIEVKDKPTNAWQPWKKLAETKWHSSEADCAKLNTHSAKWNTQNRDSSGEQDEWNSGKDIWNIECDKSEEENDQVFLPDDPEDEIEDDHLKKKKDKRSTSSSCSNSNSSCSIGSSSSRHGRRESWPILNGNLMVAPSEAERGPSPQSRHYKEILRKDSLGINPKYFASSQSSETGSCSPRHGSRCPSPRYVNRCGSPRNGVNRCASPRNGNFISSPRKGSIGSVCSVDSRKSDFDKETDWDSGVESVTSKMVLIKCKDANYLTRIYLDKEGIHALKVVGRVGAGGSAAAEHVMTEGQSGAAPGQLSSNQHAAHDDVTRGCGDVTARDNQSDNTASLISQATDIEFEHETADYQWLLDYDLPCARYRESYSREVGSASICSGRDGSGRVSVLEPSQGQLQDLSYETLARNLDANLAEIDMDDFRSEDIHNILTLPTMCGEFQSAEDGEMFASVSGSMMDRYELESSMSPHTSSHCDREEEGEDDEDNVEDRKEVDEVEEEEYSGVSGELSLYQSGPLFSPLKEPPPLANTTFSVDSLDCDSLHDDLILTCQANKDNYTIAFEGSFIHYSEDSDYHEAAESESSACSHWSAAERLEGRCTAPSMTHSDQPYTTWSRVSRRSSRTPEVPSRATQPNPSGSQLETSKLDAQAQSSSKSNSMPNLMRRSLMRRSLEAAAGCVKVYDLQNSMRSSQSSRAVANETNNFSLVKLFMRQKSLSKEAVSLSSSISQEGACCSSSDNQSNVHDSSDWPMNSQSENDMDGSASPVPPPVLMRQNGVIYHDRGFRRRTSSLGAPEITPRTNTTGNQDFNTQDTAGDAALTSGNAQQEGLLNNNNNIITAANLLDNNTVQFSNNMDNVTSFEDSLKETSPCSKPPVTSPIREEPEGMDISMDSRGESKVLLDQSEKETKMHDVLRLRDNKLNAEKNNMTPVKSLSKDVGNKNINKNAFNIRVDDRKRSQSPGTPKKGNNRRESSNTSTRRRQDSGNSSSGYMSNRGSTEKIRRPSDSEGTPQQKPRPKPRVLKQMSDQCLQTSSLKVSAMVNTSFDLDKKEVYIYYPNYALPDLGFLKDKKYNVDARVFLVPQHYISRPEEVRKARESRSRRPFSCGDMEKLRKHGFGHIKDWDSLNFLLPKELKEMLLDETDCMETTKPSFCQSPKPSRRPVSCDYTPQRYANDMKSSSSSLNSTQPSSGFRGSSTMLNDSEVESGGLDQKYLYKYDSGITDSGEGVDKPPPLPKRSISLPVDERQGPEDSDTPPPRPPLPRGILRKSTSLKEDPSKGTSGHNKRYSAIDPGRGNMREDLLKRRSLQEPMEYMAQRAARETIPEVLQANAEAEKDKEISTSPLSPMGCSCVSSQCTGFCGKGLQKKNLLRVSELPDVSSHEELTEEDLLRIRSQVSTLLVTRGNVGPILADVNNPCDLCPKKSVSFAEKKGQNPDAAAAATQGAGSELTDDETRPVVYDAHDKKTLVLSVRSAVEKLVTHFSSASSQTEKVRLGTSSVTPIVAHIALEKLCPAIYALLSDGLHPSLQSLFGKINNSVWRVIEVTSQMSPSTKALSDLVLTLNSEDCLSEGPIKFNAFIFGLLNIRSLDSWLSYIRTRESVIQKHYHPEAFLYLSNTATKTLYDDLLLALRPLTILPFNLDLLHEYKALHASLQKMEERLFLHTSSKESPGERPPSVLDHLLASKETKEFKNAAQQDRVKALMRVLTSPDLDENELLNSTSEQCRERSRSPRPRSCYEHVANEETNPTLKKRWSGVQLGSRLLTAIDKLMLEEATGTSSEDYTDSIDNPKNNRPVYSRQSEHTEDDVPSDLRISDISSRDGDVSERSASEKDTENEKGSRACANTEEDEEPEGVRFRRLQLKWEQMAGPEKRSKMPLVQPQPQPQPQQPPPPEKALSPSSGTRSRIPRPVSMTSPVRPFKPFDPSKEKTSPQVKQPPKPIAVIPKELPKPAPRRSLKDKATTPNNTNDEQANAGAARPPSVRSRLAPRPSSVNSNANTVRASSVPGRVPSGDKGNNSGRYDGQRRYGGQQRSASHGRRVAPGDMPKLVQTLHHRLATDNGHLSFNRGDILTLVVEVDDRYLLCCHNDRKGLVPRASVIVYEQ